MKKKNYSKLSRVQSDPVKSAEKHREKTGVTVCQMARDEDLHCHFIWTNMGGIELLVDSWLNMSQLRTQV